MSLLETNVEITISRLEKFIEAEVRLGIIKKAIEQEDYIVTSELKRILDMEVFKNDIG